MTTKRKGVTLDALDTEASKPLSERKEFPIGRNGDMRKPRKYHMTDQEVAELQTEAATTGGFANPYGKRIGAYYFQVQALYELGMNKWHIFNDVFEKVKELMSSHSGRSAAGRETNQWRVFCDKKPRRGVKGGKDVEGRIMQNFKVLQRIPRPGSSEKNYYGRKLQQLCMCIDIRFEPSSEGSEYGVWYYRLNNQFDSPEEVKPVYDNPRRSRKKKKKSVQVVAETSTPADVKKSVEDEKSSGVPRVAFEVDKDSGPDKIVQASEEGNQSEI